MKASQARAISERFLGNSKDAKMKTIYSMIRRAAKKGRKCLQFEAYASEKIIPDDIQYELTINGYRILTSDETPLTTIDWT